MLLLMRPKQAMLVAGLSLLVPVGLPASLFAEMQHNQQVPDETEGLESDENHADQPALDPYEVQDDHETQDVYGADDGHGLRYAGEHAHGHAYANLVVLDDGYAFEITLTGMDVVGFGVPENEAQRQAMSKAMKRLQGKEAVLSFPQGNPCRSSSVRVKSEGENDHSEFFIELEGKACDPIEAVSVTIFDTLPKLEEVDFDIVTTNGERRVTLTPGNADVSLLP